MATTGRSSRASQFYGWAAYQNQPGLHASQLAAHVVYTPVSAEQVRSSQLSAAVVFSPPSTPSIRTGQLSAWVPYQLDALTLPRVSQVFANVVWGSGKGQEARSRAWAFTLDGHPFYVLDLGVEGTFLYDMDTQQWCQWQTDGWNTWNMRFGTRWGEPERVVGADSQNLTMWELDPAITTDEGFKSIIHIATAGVVSRERVYHAVEALRLAGSLGDNTDGADAQVTLEFSDDGGRTYPFSDTVTIAQGDFSGVVEWRSLGSFRSPGRVFRVTDVGGMLRIDGADVYIDGWDDEGQTGGSQQTS